MKYVFDFDRTIFDMESLYRTIAKVNPTAELGTIGSLEGIDIASFLFSDAIEFFEQHDPQLVDILSSGHGKTGQWDPVYQAEKVKRSRVAELVNRVHIVPQDKVAVLQEIAINQTGPVVFVDDHIDNIKRVATALPDIHVVLIDRAGEITVNTTTPLIRSLAELDATIGV